MISRIIFLEYSFFINSEQDDAIEEIPSMPGVSRFGVNQVIAHLEPLVKKGLKTVLLFGVIENLPKVRFKDSPSLLFSHKVKKTLKTKIKTKSFSMDLG